MRVLRGFTLIELLVVIAIISFLTAIALVNLNTARSNARDAKRLGDLDNMRQALVLYFENNGRYPEFNWSTTAGAMSYGDGADWANFTNSLAPYIKVPLDPINAYTDPEAGNHGPTYGDHVYYYLTNSIGANGPQEYDFYMLLENPHPRACPNTSHRYHSNPPVPLCQEPTKYIIPDH